VGALYIEGAGSLLNKGIVLSAKYKLMSECSVHAYSGLLLLQLQFWWSVHGVNSLFDFAAPCPLMIWLTWQLAHLLNSIATPAAPKLILPRLFMDRGAVCTVVPYSQFSIWCHH
jgi:hypothetical protein